MKKYKLSELVVDFDLYPRGSVDTYHVAEIVSAIEAGAVMPPIVICQKSKRIADGVHRVKGYMRLYGEDHEVECVEKKYKSDGELLLDAMRYNASHGRALTQHDKAHCLILGEKLKLSMAVIADALNLTAQRVDGLRTNRIARIGRRPIALKSTIRHMAGINLTHDQEVANKKLGGMNQLFYVNQLITLIESDLIDMDNADLVQGMDKLRSLLERFFAKAA